MSMTGPNASAGQLPVSQWLETRQIRRDGGTQARARLAESVVKEYAAKMADGIVFPPVTVWFDGEFYWLSDGFHRLAAQERLDRPSILAEVLAGTLSDALWASCSSNSTHGARRSSDDIKAALVRATQHPNALRLSNREIARHLGISEATFRRWSQRLSTSSDADNVRSVTRNGKEYLMHTGKIGHRLTHPPVPSAKSLKQIRTGVHSRARCCAR